jgi:hypothetical protein
MELLRILKNRSLDHRKC